MIGLLLVDDEAPARAKVRRILEDRDDVVVVHEATDGEEALAWLECNPKAPVDAVLLDIQMPGRSGVEIATALPPELLVVFVTAYEEFALRAFDLNAVDYLLKPFTRERLLACVTRLQDRLSPPERARQRQQLASALHALQPVAGHWLVAQRGMVHRLDLDEIECVEAADNYIELHARGRSWLDRITLTAFLQHPLSASRFVRVHRSYAIQFTHVVSTVALERGDAMLTLTSGRQVRLSRRHRDIVKNSAAWP